MAEKENLPEKLIRWLSDQGYPLEMRVAQTIASSGLFVTQSDFYTDYETGKSREIDVTSRSIDSCEASDGHSAAELEIHSMIECKSHQKPWIVFKGAKSSLWEFETPLRNNEASRLMVKRTKDGFLLNIAKDAATGITQAFTKGKDIPYGALMGALKAAEAKVRTELKNESERTEHEGPLYDLDDYSFSACAFPVVVTDARLFECYLTGSGEMEICEVEYAAVAIRYPRREADWENGTVVYVFRESSVGLFIDGLEEFRVELKDKLPKLLS